MYVLFRHDIIWIRLPGVHMMMVVLVLLPFVPVIFVWFLKLWFWFLLLLILLRVVVCLLCSRGGGGGKTPGVRGSPPCLRDHSREPRRRSVAVIRIPTIRMSLCIMILVARSHHSLRPVIRIRTLRTMSRLNVRFLIICSLGVRLVWVVFVSDVVALYLFVSWVLLVLVYCFWYCIDIIGVLSTRSLIRSVSAYQRCCYYY